MTKANKDPMAEVILMSGPESESLISAMSEHFRIGIDPFDLRVSGKPIIDKDGNHHIRVRSGPEQLNSLNPDFLLRTVQGIFKGAADVALTKQGNVTVTPNERSFAALTF